MTQNTTNGHKTRTYTHHTAYNNITQNKATVVTHHDKHNIKHNTIQ